MYRVLPSLPIRKDFLIDSNRSCQCGYGTLFSLHVQRIIGNDVLTIDRDVIADNLESAYNYVINLQNMFLKNGTKVTYILIKYEMGKTYDIAM